MDDQRRLTRRAFLRASLTGTSAALLAACGASQPAAEAPAAPAATTAPAAPAATTAPAAPAATEAPAAAAPTTAPAEAPAASGSGGKMVVLQRQEYFPDVETAFRDEVTSFITGNGAELDISTVNPENFGDFTAKMQAAVEAGNPPDLAYQTNINPQQLYFLDTLEDVTDVVEEAISQYGMIVPLSAEKNAKVDGRWYSVPFFSHTGAWFGRKDVFEAAGIDVTTLDTFDKRRDAALQVSDPEKEIWGWGLTVNKSGDGHGAIIAVIHSFGGRVVDETGEKVVFNSPETVQAVTWLAETYAGEQYKPMLPPGIESWTDPTNNENYLAGKIALTQNAFSVYAAAKKDNNPVFPNTAVMPFPVDKDGMQLSTPASGWFHIFRGAANVDLAKETILHMLNPERLLPLIRAGGGLILPAYMNQWTDEVLALDPNFAALQTIITSDSAYNGFPYPANANPATAAAEASAFQSEMMANVISGAMTPEQAVEDAHSKIVRIFEELGLPQA
jgi:multiple sugar transport system substrate-binding protein